MVHGQNYLKGYEWYTKELEFGIGLGHIRWINKIILGIESYQMFQRQNYLKGYEWYTYEIELELSIGLGHIR